MPDSSHVEAPILTSNGLSYPAPEAMDLASEILAQLTEGVVTLADDDSVVSWNPGAASLTGYTLAEMHTLGLPRLFDAPEEFLPLIRQAHTGCTSPDVRLVLTRADGQRIPVGVRCSPLLFSPFHTTKPAGTGLGLYLVQEIVTAHHGETTVCSTPGVGTTFTVMLPRLDAAATSLVTG